jgi:hypothetical protein
MGLSRNNDDDENEVLFNGYIKTLIHFYNTERESIDSVYLWLPENNKTKTLASERMINAKFVKDEISREKFKEDDEKAAFLRSLRSSSDDDIKFEIFKKEKATRLDQLNCEVEGSDLFERFQTDSETAKDEFKVQVYAWDEPLKIISNVLSKSVDPDAKKRHLELYHLLKEKGCFRRLSGMEVSFEKHEAVYALYDSHPNFRAVIDFVREQLTLCEAQGKPLRFVPCLIYGPPGIGKTDFSQTLAAAINTPLTRVGFDSGLTDSTLVGSASHWGNSTPGILFEKLVFGDVINPIFLLDEIDKADRGSRAPLRPLHSILEPVTSSKVTDISVGLDMDTSYVIWIATANDPGLIPSPLRSRFKEFHVDHPQGADALKLAQTMALKTLAELALQDMAPVDRQIVKLLAHMTAREQSQALKQAFAKAVLNGRQEVIEIDLPAEVFLDDESPTKSSQLH